eukprot:gene8953-6281_t
MDTFVKPFLQQLADNNDFEAISDWVDNNFWLPIGSVILYAIFVHGVPKLMKNREPFQMNTLNTIWNLGLSIFSIIGAWYCWPRLIEVVTASEISGLTPSKGNYFYEYKNMLTDVNTMSPAMKRNVFQKPDGTYGIRGGFDTSVCVYRDDIYRRGVVGYLNQAFLFSKYFELFDTVLLVLQKKRVIFLHWYHHVTVLLYCAHAWVSPAPGGIWFATVNLTVHSVMYFYYFLASLNFRKLIAPFASFITIFQITQMVMGSAIAVYVMYHDQFSGKGCDTSKVHSHATIIMYISYLILFSNFFIQRYIVKKPRRAPGQKPKSGKDHGDRSRWTTIEALNFLERRSQRPEAQKGASRLPFSKKKTPSRTLTPFYRTLGRWISKSSRVVQETRIQQFHPYHHTNGAMCVRVRRRAGKGMPLTAFYYHPGVRDGLDPIVYPLQRCSIRSEGTLHSYSGVDQGLCLCYSRSYMNTSNCLSFFFVFVCLFVFCPKCHAPMHTVRAEMVEWEEQSGRFTTQYFTLNRRINNKLVF